MTFSEWNATIIGPMNTKFDQRIFSLKVICGPDYPKIPPTIRFITKINLPGIDSKGVVEPG